MSQVNLNALTCDEVILAMNLREVRKLEVSIASRLAAIEEDKYRVRMLRNGIERGEGGYARIAEIVSAQDAHDRRFA